MPDQLAKAAMYALRHALWWARECIVPSCDAMAEVSEHPSGPFQWPSLEEQQVPAEG